MMAIAVGGQVYELEGVLLRGVAACSLREAGGRLITADDLDQLAEEDRAALLALVRRHIEAVALLADNRLARRVSAPNGTRGAS